MTPIVIKNVAGKSATEAKTSLQKNENILISLPIKK